MWGNQLVVVMQQKFLNGNLGGRIWQGFAGGLASFYSSIKAKCPIWETGNAVSTVVADTPVNSWTFTQDRLKLGQLGFGYLTLYRYADCEIGGIVDGEKIIGIEISILRDLWFGGNC